MLRYPGSETSICPYCGGSISAGGGTHGICPQCAWSILDPGEDENEVTPGEWMALPGLRVVSEIARGGMGIVYRAIEAEAGREVAVKMMQPALADSPEARERFAQEARAMGALDHPGILPVYRVGAYEGLPYFTMKLAEQGTLSGRRPRYAHDWRGVAVLMAAIAEAVHYAHQRGLLHRDLKPANILFDAADHAFVSDFGLVKAMREDSSLTRSIAPLGTPHYMAPEVAEHDARAASVASDVWSLGAMLYELFAQRLLFEAEGLPALLRKIVEDEPVPLPAAVPRDLATITGKCLHKTPERRYASAGDLAADLRRWLRGEPVTARRQSAGERVWRWCRRRPALAAISGLLVLSVAGGGILIVAKNRELNRTLRASLLNEAHAIRTGAGVLGRDEGLLAVRKAARLGSSPELEEEAASLLALSSVKLVDKITTGRSWTHLIPDPNLVNAANFSRADGIRIVELRSHRELAKLPPGRAYLSSRDCFSNDGQLFFYMSPEADKLVVCEWRTGRILREFEWTGRYSANFTPDGWALAFGRKDGSIERHDLRDEGIPPVIWNSVGSGLIRPLDFSPDGRWLSVASGTNQVSVIDAQTGGVRCVFGIANDGKIGSSCWSGDSLGMMIGTLSGMVRSWSISGGPSRLLPDHAAQVYGVAVQPQGQIAISSAYEARSYILDWPSGRAIGVIPGNSKLTRFSRDGCRLSMGDEGLGVLKLYDVASPEVCRQFVPPDLIGGKRLKKGSWCAQTRPGGRIVTAVNFGSTDVYDLATARYLGALPEGNGNTLAWSADGQELWVCEGRNLVRRRFEDQADGRIVTRRSATIDLQGHAGARLSLAEKADRWVLTTLDGVLTGSIAKNDAVFIPPPPEWSAKMELNPLGLSPDGRWAIVSPGFDDKLGILDLHERRWVKLIPCDRYTYSAFTPDGRWCWLGTMSELWRLDMRSLEVVKKIADRREPGTLGLLEMTSDGRLLAVVDTSSVVLRKGETGEPFLRLEHPMPRTAAWVSLTPEGRYLTFSGAGHVLQVWDLARLAREFRELGLPWRGPELGRAAESRPVPSLTIE